MGRPSEYTPERGEAILARLAVGDTLRAICRGEDAPGLTTVYRWLEADADFRERYARAREIQAHTWADEVVDAARTAGDDANAARVLVDALKWRASKGSPKYYGDKVALEHSTPPGQPIQVQATADPESLAALANLIGELGTAVEAAP